MDEFGFDEEGAYADDFVLGVDDGDGEVRVVAFAEPFEAVYTKQVRLGSKGEKERGWCTEVFLFGDVAYGGEN